MDLTKVVLSRLVPCMSHRMYVTAPTRPLQKIFGIGKSEKEKQLEEACQKAKEATDTVKEGAKQIKETSEDIKNTADKVKETAGDIVNKIKEPIISAASKAWSNSTKKIEDKVAEKIRDRVMGKEERQINDEKSN